MVSLGTQFDNSEGGANVKVTVTFACQDPRREGEEEKFGQS